MTSNPVTSVFFRWVTCETDPRPYKPGKPVLEPIDMLVEVKLPITNIYISNSIDVLNAQVTNQITVKPILTPEGMKYCIETLEKAMSPHKDFLDDSDDNTLEPTDTNDVEWQN